MHRSIKTKVLIKVLQDLGYANTRTNGGHAIFSRKATPGIVVLPITNNELSAGTYASIKKHILATGLVDEFHFDKLVQENN